MSLISDYLECFEYGAPTRRVAPRRRQLFMESFSMNFLNDRELLE